MTQYRIETDSLGDINVPAAALWGAQTQRALTLFQFDKERMPSELIVPYAILKKACALANQAQGHLDAQKTALIVRVCDEIIAGQHHDMFPLPVWISGSGTQYNMNVNEVIANRCSQLTHHPLGSATPVHPNDHVNKSQSTNDNFPSAMHMSVVIESYSKLIPSIRLLKDAFSAKVTLWKDIIKIGRTHMQDATPLTLGHEFSGFETMLKESLYRVDSALNEVYALPLGGTAVGTGLNTHAGFAEDAIGQIAELTGQPFIPASNTFALQGSHDALVQFSATLKTLAVALNKIANDIRILACGPRAGIAELILPANEPGSSIMPGKVNPTQCEALTMIALQVMANDTAVTLGGTSGALQMNAYKPLIIRNLLQSIRLLTHGMHSFRNHLLTGLKPDENRIKAHLNQSLMLVTALTPTLGYDKAAAIAHHAHTTGQTLKETALQMGITEHDFEKIVVPQNMLGPHE
ncbi:class II fumarate hydratase [Pseudodesulfovibrio sp. JC047]|uniref:class II fumarate hydratase n=1 Tax=Pseudodesulfovibrio sp. JC047 TaxID=2683199 RepID=UPI0013D48C26|nr:class II fumarate hydratase [Pseudodesulfovibrio sp. JC047]NDV18214.1 class II fumarate hydratase [Pseudodesulfovibrio sp. JC047]